MIWAVSLSTLELIPQSLTNSRQISIKHSEFATVCYHLTGPYRNSALPLNSASTIAAPKRISGRTS